MGKSLNDLARDIKAFDKGLRKAASDLAKRRALDVTEKLAQATPVDTSTALSNWRVSMGFPTTTSIAAYFPGQGGSTQDSSANAVVDKARQTLARKKPGQVIWIANNIPYIQQLANGTGSAQQPNPGWIQEILEVGEERWKPKWPIM